MRLAIVGQATTLSGLSCLYPRDVRVNDHEDTALSNDLEVVHCATFRDALAELSQSKVAYLLTLPTIAYDAVPNGFAPSFVHPDSDFIRRVLGDSYTESAYNMLATRLGILLVFLCQQQFHISGKLLLRSPHELAKKFEEPIFNLGIIPVLCGLEFSERLATTSS